MTILTRAIERIRLTLLDRAADAGRHAGSPADIARSAEIAATMFSGVKPDDRTATIEYLNPKGLTILREDDTQQLFAATFDKFSGYRGQTARAFGLAKGRRIRFEAEGEKVVAAHLLPR